MNQSHDMTTLTLKVPGDVREKLKAWATHNVTSMTAELVRSVRERMARERAEREQAVR
ncbi:Arc family DNA-binding protein [Bradyrhizobium sp. 521_C7_N1_3]|uniref:Arc family DNA-binding protein n=1 Tax=Bradyrhizobium TaxID=374 RepID=UPI001BACD9D9|nr:Arc family DNA-binding protein [Bradyrhizobium japonicum]MBR0910822.1 Arc family DNA-binding protein [Bradyrhizobium japonicum]